MPVAGIGRCDVVRAGGCCLIMAIVPIVSSLQIKFAYTKLICRFARLLLWAKLDMPERLNESAQRAAHVLGQNLNAREVNQRSAKRLLVCI
jgi:hypothetical protein